MANNQAPTRTNVCTASAFHQLFRRVNSRFGSRLRFRALRIGVSSLSISDLTALASISPFRWPGCNTAPTPALWRSAARRVSANVRQKPVAKLARTTVRGHVLQVGQGKIPVTKWHAGVAIAALALGAWLGVPRASAAESTPAGPDVRPTDAVLVGSSSFNQAFGRIIQREVERMGYQVTRRGVSGAGLARPDYHDMSQVLESLPIGAHTAAVFVYLGVNDAQAVWLHPHERGPSGPTTVPFGTDDWDAVYTRRTQEFLHRICERGARRALVLLPVDVNRPDLQRSLDRIRRLQVHAASATSCAVTVQTAGDAGQFSVEGLPKRMPDGFHMTALGAQIIWDRVEPEVSRLLHGNVDMERRRVAEATR